LSSPLLCDPAEKASREAANGVQQLDYISSLVLERGITDIRDSHVRELHQIAVDGIYPCGGTFRDALSRVQIQGSEHKIPHEALVPGLVHDLIEKLNADRTRLPGLERASYALWRFNWIHPFRGGNGRTARALSYLVLCIDMGLAPPGKPQVPTIIYARRGDYVKALRMADETEKTGQADISLMRALLDDAITQQLASVLARLGSTQQAKAHERPAERLIGHIRRMWATAQVWRQRRRGL
jgi:Fic family protein